MTEVLTLYSAKVCPYAQRVELALEETGVKYDRFEIDLQNKPEWYAPKVNPASKVPAVAFGGPKVPADQPSPESTKIAESLILLEFVNDLDPNHRLLPSDPVQKAKARFFIDTFTNKFAPAWMGVLLKGESIENLYKGIEALQDLLPAKGKGKFAVGDDFSLADAAVLPFFARMEVALKNDIGLYPIGMGKKVYETLQSDAKYERFREYFNALKERESFKKTFDEEYIKQKSSARFAGAERQKA